MLNAKEFTTEVEHLQHVGIKRKQVDTGMKPPLVCGLTWSMSKLTLTVETELMLLRTSMLRALRMGRQSQTTTPHGASEYYYPRASFAEKT